MNEYDVRLSRLPADPEGDVDGWKFDAAEIALLRQGKEVIADNGDDRYYVTAPITWAAIFASNRHPVLAKFIATGDDQEVLRQQARDFLIATVGAENQWHHKFLVVPLDSVPAWHGSLNADRRIRREKDDLCAWEHATGF